MREYKFRFYDKTDKCMRYFTLNEMLERHFAYYGSFDTKVLESEKQQYTGLNDANGVEIYEGDIVKDDCGLIGNVTYSSEEYDGIAGFMVFDVYDGLQNRDGFWHLVEVIGNIYENPELLEGRVS